MNEALIYWTYKETKAWIISFGANDQFDKLFFVFVAYIEGKKYITNQVLGHPSNFKIYQVVSLNQETKGHCLNDAFFFEFQRKKALIIFVGGNDQFDE